MTEKKAIDLPIAFSSITLTKIVKVMLEELELTLVDFDLFLRDKYKFTETLQDTVEPKLKHKGVVFVKKDIYYHKLYPVLFRIYKNFDMQIESVDLLTTLLMHSGFGSEIWDVFFELSPNLQDKRNEVKELFFSCEDEKATHDVSLPVRTTYISYIQKLLLSMSEIISHSLPQEKAVKYQYVGRFLNEDDNDLVGDVLTFIKL